MLRPIARICAPFTLSASVALVWLFAGCRGPEVTIAESYDAGPPRFGGADAEAGAPELVLTEYCPLTTCPAPFTTCGTSAYPCDINLMTDPKNCGSCGFECKGSGNAVFGCASGKCTFRCRDETTADCNGIVDDDCEVTLGTNDNCNACGERCPDPKKPCIYDEATHVGRCGCEPGFLYCGIKYGSHNCVDPTTDDKNCAACDNACDPTDGGDGGTPPAHTYYGCLKSECGHLKCSKPYADCDQDSSNGCETSLVSIEHCGACNNPCAPGQICREYPNKPPECICPPGETLCGKSCVNLTTSPSHCGACGNSCKRIGENANHVGTCVYGYCTYECRQGWGDCNGDPSDGCEVNLGSDQRNCGACGNACDVLAGQPCIAGQCAVHPCGEGEEAR